MLSRRDLNPGAGSILTARWRDEILHHAALHGHPLSERTQVVAIKRGTILPHARCALGRHSVLYIDERALSARGYEASFLNVDVPAAGMHKASTLDARQAATEAKAIARRLIATKTSALPTKDLIDKLSAAFPQPLSDLALAGIPDIPPPRTVSPEDAKDRGTPEAAMRLLAERYGWTKRRGRWTGDLLPLQRRVLQSAFVDADAPSGILAAPTSSGKTFLAELLALRAYFKEERKTVMLVPTREIGVERAAAYATAFGERDGDREGRLRIAYSDGEHSAHDGRILHGSFDLAIMVNEKLRYFQHRKAFIRHVGLLVIDELEVMAHGQRGSYLEMALASILPDTHIRIIGLTRPSTNLDDVERSLRNSGRPTTTLLSYQRPTALSIGVWSPATQRVTFTNSNTLKRTSEALSMPYPGRLRDSIIAILTYAFQRGARNVVFATPTKRYNLMLAELLLGIAAEHPEVRKALGERSGGSLVAERLRGLEQSQRKSLLDRLIPVGIGVHDADMSVDERNLVGTAFRSGDLAILVSTQTLAYGVNTPADVISFVGWGQRPPGDPPRPPYYSNLARDYISWLGRVGRYGMLGDLAQSIYVAQSAEGSDEYDTMTALGGARDEPFGTHLDEQSNLEQAVLYALRTLRTPTTPAVTYDRLVAFFSGTPSGARAPLPVIARISNALLRLTGGRMHDSLNHLEEVAHANGDLTAAYQRIVTYTNEPRAPYLRDLARAIAAVSVASRENNNTDASPVIRWALRDDVRPRFLIDHEADAPVIISDKATFELSRVGLLATAYGVESDTIRAMMRVSRDLAGTSVPPAIVLDAMWRTPDGDAIRALRFRRSAYPELKARADARSLTLGRDLGDIPRATTVQALEAWLSGHNIGTTEATQPGIEDAFELDDTNASLYRTARDFSRLSRILEASADIALEEQAASDEPYRPATVGVRIPQDLGALAEHLKVGVHPDYADLASLNVDGLSRTWHLRLAAALDGNTDPDLSGVERLRELAQNDPISYRAALPTPGLAARLLEAAEDSPRDPLAKSLRNARAAVTTHYEHSVVQSVLLHLARDRYTAMRVKHRGRYLAFRRNATKGQPATLRSPSDITDWVRKGAMEFLSEVGYFERPDTYMIDRLVLDVDAINEPDNDFLARVVSAAWRKLAQHPWVQTDGVRAQHSGRRGYHVIAELEGARDVTSVTRALNALAAELSNDVNIFPKEQVGLTDPHVVLDVSTVRRRGIFRDALSLNPETAFVCWPVTPETIADGRPDVTIERAAKLMRGDPSDPEGILQALPGSK